MKRGSLVIISTILFVIGLILLVGSLSITGNVISDKICKTTGSILGLAFIIGGILLFVGSLEQEVSKKEKLISFDKNWKKFPVNKKSIIEDIEQEYLSREKTLREKTPIQERIERAVTGGTLIEENMNKKRTYEEQFYEGHASKGGRIIDVKSHITKKGKHKGKLIHFGQPANAVYLWIVDEEGNFIIGNRKPFHHEMSQMNREKIDYEHRMSKLPHPTLGRGRKVYGSGQVYIRGGKVEWYNAQSGHYLDLKDIKGFNEQGKNVFKKAMEYSGLKGVEGGAVYKKPKKKK